MIDYENRETSEPSRPGCAQKNGGILPAALASSAQPPATARKKPIFKTVQLTFTKRHSTPYNGDMSQKAVALSNREREVLEHLANGLTQSETADRLGLSP